jgi:hypothetical protein
MKTRKLWPLAALLLAACGSTNRNPNQHAPSGGTNAGGVAAVTAGEAGEAAGGETACASTLSVPAGLVRLTFNEINASLIQLFGADAAKAIGADLELDYPNDAFPPLASPTEGAVIAEPTFIMGDKMAQNAGAYVREHFEVVTKCAADDYACVNDFVKDLAERAFRRALTAEEQDTLERVVVGAEALGAPAEQGAEYGVYAVLESPHFLYRTELGPSAAAATTGEVRLSDDELASSLAFFLTGAPPDQALLDAAKAHDLGGPDQLAAHVERLLASPAGRQHLERMLGNNFGLSRLQTVVIDSAVYPGFNRGVAQSMERELQLFLQDTLWNQPVSSLLTSRSARVDASLAAIYGVQLPGSGLDADGFAQVELPESRAGLLTRAGMLTSRSRPDGPSVVGRGLWVFSNFMCAEAPAFPDMVAAMMDDPNRPAPNASARELAEYRMKTEPCDTCHVEFDPYGLALDEFDGVGRYRTTDPEGRPIDTAVKLPAAAGGATIKGGTGLSDALAGEIFETCLTQRFLSLALASAVADYKGVRCEAESQTLPANPTFTDLLSNVALSRAFATRTR